MIEINELGEFYRDGKKYNGFKDNCGYLKVKLNNKSKFIHKLVAEKYLGETPAGFSINHKNGIKTDNRLENLEIIEHRENVRHAWRVGLCNPSRGEKHGRSILDDMKVLTLLTLPKKSSNGRGLGFSNIELSNLYNVSETRVSNIRSGKEWKHLQPQH